MAQGQPVAILLSYISPSLVLKTFHRRALANIWLAFASASLHHSPPLFPSFSFLYHHPRLSRFSPLSLSFPFHSCNRASTVDHFSLLLRLLSLSLSSLSHFLFSSLSSLVFLSLDFTGSNNIQYMCTWFLSFFFFSSFFRVVVSTYIQYLATSASFLSGFICPLW